MWTAVPRSLWKWNNTPSTYIPLKTFDVDTTAEDYWPSVDPVARPSSSSAMADIPGNYSDKAVHEKSSSAEKDGQWSTSEQELYDAVFAENAEHQLGVWEAAKKQPVRVVLNAFVLRTDHELDGLHLGLHCVLHNCASFIFPRGRLGC